MGATFNRVKTWTTETLTASDLNAEFDNILDNLTPAGVDDYSGSVATMQVQTDPGEQGSESLATSLQGEVERLRFMISEITGKTYWYESAATSLAELNNALGGNGLAANRISSGKSSSNSSQSLLLTPNGTDDGFTINATTTNLVYYVDGVQYTLSSDVSVSATTTAPTTNNTAAANDAGYNDQIWTKWTGMYGGQITIDTIGSEITSKNGKLASFKLGGGSTEYLFGRVDTTNNRIKDVRRGWFFDSSNAYIPATAFADADTLTLMSTTWVFLSTTGTALTTNNEPIYSKDEPAAPAVNDMWYDIANSTWKKWNGAAHEAANATFIGIVVTDENDNCVAARSEDFSGSFSETNNINIDNALSNTVVTGDDGGDINVYNTYIDFGSDIPTWDITTDLDTGTEAASTLYFCYIKENGETVLSAVAPEDFTKTRKGLYHPHETWRCVGQVWNNSSSNFDEVISYHGGNDPHAMRADADFSAGAVTFNFWCSPLVKHKMYASTAVAGVDYVTRAFNFYQSLTIPAGATLDHSSAIDDTIVFHIMVNGQDAQLGVSSHQRGVQEVVNSVALGTGATSNTMYTTEAYTGAYCKAIACGQSEQTNAGTWASAFTAFTCSPQINSCRRVYKLISNSASVSGTASQVLGATNYFHFQGKRDVRITLTSYTINNAFYYEITNSGSGIVDCDLLFYVNSTGLRNFSFYRNVTTTATESGITLRYGQPISSLFHAGEVAAGNKAINLYAQGAGANDGAAISYAYFLIEEQPFPQELLI